MNKLWSIICFVAWCGVAEFSTVLAQAPSNNSVVEANLSRLKETNACPKCDFRYADLSGADLESTDLRKAKLRGANLSNASLERADLRKSDLREADLRGANLSGAKLNLANLSGADLDGANLTGARLKSALVLTDLSKVNLQGANLTGAHLSYDYPEPYFCNTILPDGSTDSSGCGSKRTRKSPNQWSKRKKRRPRRSTSKTATGSGFLISKLGHVLTNAHVVKGCIRITVRGNTKVHVAADIISQDKVSDLALLKLSDIQKFSDGENSLSRRTNSPKETLVSYAQFRSANLELGEQVMVAGYPFGKILGDGIKVTTGIVSSVRGLGDDSGRFQIDAATQPGNSGGPIYGQSGEVVGVIVSQLSKLKMVKYMGNVPENVNFGIKVTTVKQFLNTIGFTLERAQESNNLTTRNLAKVAQKETLMIRCHL